MPAFQPLPEPLLPDSLGIVTQLGAFLIVSLALYAIGAFLLGPRLDRWLERRGVDPTVRAGLDRFGNVFLLVAAAAVGALAAGFARVLAASAIVVAAVTVSIGVAAREVTGNLVSGLVIIADPDLNFGDWIACGDVEGIITDIGYRATRIRTYDNERVTIPNSKLVSQVVTNTSVHDVLRSRLLFAIAYEDDIPTARRLILEEIGANEDVLGVPEPDVLLREFGDSYVGLEARVWVANPTRAEVLEVRSELFEAVKRRFDDAGIQLQPPSPHRLSGELAVEHPGESG